MKVEVGGHLELIVDEMFGEDEFVIEDGVLVLLHHVQEGEGTHVSHFLVAELELATGTCFVILKCDAHEFFALHEFFIINFTDGDQVVYPEDGGEALVDSIQEIHGLCLACSAEQGQKEKAIGVIIQLVEAECLFKNYQSIVVLFAEIEEESSAL